MLAELYLFHLQLTTRVIRSISFCLFSFSSSSLLLPVTLLACNNIKQMKCLLGALYFAYFFFSSLSLLPSLSHLYFSLKRHLSHVWVTSRLRFVWEEESVFKCPCWREDREKESYKILLHLISYSFHACDSPFYYLPFRSSVLEKFPSIVFLRVCPLLNLTAKCSSAWADNWLP